MPNKTRRKPCKSCEFVSVCVRAVAVPLVPELVRDLVRVLKPVAEYVHKKVYPRNELFDPRIYDATHKAVVVTFKCRKCGKECTRRYERNKALTPHMDTRGYKPTYMSCNIPITNLPLELVEERFNTLPCEQYDLLWNNCGHWAKSLFVLLIHEKFATAPVCWVDSNGYLDFDRRWFDSQKDHRNKYRFILKYKKVECQWLGPNCITPARKIVNCYAFSAKDHPLYEKYSQEYCDEINKTFYVISKLFYNKNVDDGDANLDSRVVIKSKVHNPFITTAQYLNCKDYEFEDHTFSQVTPLLNYYISDKTKEEIQNQATIFMETEKNGPSSNQCAEGNDYLTDDENDHEFKASSEADTFYLTYVEDWGSEQEIVKNYCKQLGLEFRQNPDILIENAVTTKRKRRSSSDELDYEGVYDDPPGKIKILEKKRDILTEIILPSFEEKSERKIYHKLPLAYSFDDYETHPDSDHDPNSELDSDSDHDLDANSVRNNALLAGKERFEHALLSQGFYI